jgi:hypothetical protein
VKPWVSSELFYPSNDGGSYAAAKGSDGNGATYFSTHKGEEVATEHPEWGASWDQGDSTTEVMSVRIKNLATGDASVA